MIENNNLEPNNESPEGKTSFKEKIKNSWNGFCEKTKALWEKANYGYRKVDVAEYPKGYDAATAEVVIEPDIREVKYRKPTAILIGALVVLALVAISFVLMDIGTIRFRWEAGWDFIAGLFKAPYNENIDTFPYNVKVYDWASWCGYMQRVWLPFLVETALPSLWNTVELCFLATLFGGLISIPIYHLCARNVVKHGYIYEPVRIINDIIRTIPTITLCTIFAMIYGFTNFAGIIMMVIFTLGIIYKIMYEYIETLDMQPFEAMYSAGGRRLQAVALGLHPSIKPMFLANMLYVFEMNIRGSLILGYAGIIDSLGYKITDWSHDSLDYWKVGVTLVPLFVLVIILQLVSNYVGRKMR